VAVHSALRLLMLHSRLHRSNPHAFLRFVRSYSYPLSKDFFDGVLWEFCDLCIHVQILLDTRHPPNVQTFPLPALREAKGSNVQTPPRSNASILPPFHSSTLTFPSRSSRFPRHQSLRRSGATEAISRFGPALRLRPSATPPACRIWKPDRNEKPGRLPSCRPLD
jgi:hypothetical protein